MTTSKSTAKARQQKAPAKTLKKKVSAKPAAKPRPVDSNEQGRGEQQNPQVAAGPQIPYHFVVTFEKEGGERVNADGILAMPVPILNQETYNAVKGLLAEHFKVENVKAVLISSLTRMDGVQLLMQPVQAQ